MNDNNQKPSKYRDAIKEFDKANNFTGVVKCRPADTIARIVFEKRRKTMTAKELRERFNGLFEQKYLSPAEWPASSPEIIEQDLHTLRGLVGDIVIWIEEQESKGEKQ